MPPPFSVIQGVDGGVSAVMFVGYHARAGSQNAILDHTWSNSTVAGLHLNGRVVGEIGWNAAVCGHSGVPLILVSGDQTACAEAAELLPVETAVVKHATGRMAAECLPPEVSQQRIYEAAIRAVRRLRDGRAPSPLCLDLPVTGTLDLVTSDMADRPVRFPGVCRIGGRQIEFTAPEVPAAYAAFRAIVAVARG